MKYKKGDYVKITANNSGHEFEIGEVVNIKTVEEGEYTAHNFEDYWYINDEDIECKVDKEIRWAIRLLKVNEWATETRTIAIVMSLGDACIMAEALNESSPDNYIYTIEEL